MTSKDVMIIFDTKGDYIQKFPPKTNDAVLANAKPYCTLSDKWNLFREIAIDGYTNESIVMNAQELCRALFADRELRTNNPFFPNAARDLLSGIVIVFLRLKKSGAIGQDKCTNNMLKSLLDSYTKDKLIALLRTYRDMQTKTQYIQGDTPQSQGVLSELYSITGDLFTGVFSGSGVFSVRNFVRKRGGHTLFIEYDMAVGDTLAPVYSLLFDLALKEALSRKTADGNVYLILDELKLLPHLRHLEDGINFGRSLGLKIIAGLQSIDQLDAVYNGNEAAARNAIAGFSSIFAFRPNDPKTREYVSQIHGQNLMLEQITQLNGKIENVQRMGHVVEDWDLINLRPGEAVVGLPNVPPFKFAFAPYR